MCKQKRASLRNHDKKETNEKTLFESLLREMEELANEAGDWRTHLPYEAFAAYRKDSAVRKQYADHYNSCSFCQNAVDALNPDD